MHTITVDIWSDIACPWCYIGTRRFGAGLAQFRDAHPELDVTVEYHSFQLSPDMPADFSGNTVDLLVRHKGMDQTQVRSMLDSVTRTAAAEGLEFDFSAQVPTNTAKAHELLHHAKAGGKQAEANERLFRAHFVEGGHVGRLEDLVELAVEIGLDRDDTTAALRDGVHTAAVDADISRARSLGISGVPFYVIDGRYGLSGAQPPETFAAALEPTLTADAPS